MPRRQCQWGYSVFYCWVAYTITSVSSLMRTCSLRPPRWYQWYGLSKSSFCKDCILGLPSTTEPPNSMSMCAWPNKRARQLLSYSLNIFVLTAEYTPACSMLKWERMCVSFLFVLSFLFDYTSQNKHGTWKWTRGKGDSYWKPSFPGSMLNFGGVLLSALSSCFWLIFSVQAAILL